jgi:SAM-dependent methyltransferase
VALDGTLSMTMGLGLQKVCDIHDFFHPEIDQIVRRELGSVPFGSRRAWEFAMIFRALREKGKLHVDAAGLGLGAGTERLIYALARHAGKVVATDLYTHEGGWVGVRTADPNALVTSKAPWPIAAGRIEALSMDMRDIKFPDNSFDFCWSTGAIEHIGDDDDFSRHFSEVHRVLKPGGVYAFTTVIAFGWPTLRIPHNYYFNPEHLIDLLHASPLHAEETFDCSVTDHLFNRPHFERFKDFGLPAGIELSKPVVSFRRGVLLTANVMLLTKDPGRPKKRPVVLGYEATTKQLRRHVENITAHLWKEPQLIRVERHDKRLVVQPQYFGNAKIAIEVTLAAGAPLALDLEIKSRGIDDFHNWQVERESRVTLGAPNVITLEAVDSRIYNIAIDDTATDPDRVIVRAKRISGSDSTKSLEAPAPSAPRLTLHDRLAILRRALS